MSSPKEWAKYDQFRNNSQKQTIQTLQEQIKEFEKREKAFQAHLKYKEHQIKLLKKEIDDLIKRDKEIILEKSSNELTVDPLLQDEFLLLKNIIKEKDETLAEKEQELESLQTMQPNHSSKQFISKCRELVKEDYELNDYIQIGILENLKFENGLEKSQIDQLMLKIKEKEIINAETDEEVNEVNNEVNKLNEKNS